MAYGTPRAILIRDAANNLTPICVKNCLPRLVELGLIRFTSRYDQQTRYDQQSYGGVERAVAQGRLAGVERAILEGQDQDELETMYCTLCNQKLSQHCTDY